MRFIPNGRTEAAPSAWSTERKATTGLLLGLVTVTIVGLVSQVSLRRQRTAADEVMRAHQILDSFGRVRASMQDLESAERSFVLTGDEAFLRSYPAALRTLRRARARARELVTEPGQRELLERLRVPVARRLSTVRSTIAVRRSRGFEVARRRIATAKGQRAVDAIKDLTTMLARNERRALAARVASVRADVERTRVVIWIGMLLSAGIVLGASALVRMDMAARRTLEHALRAARTAAEKANRAKSDFLARMSHEIRTPMNGIIGMTQLVLQGELPGGVRRHLEMVASSAVSLLRIINDILDLSKVEVGKLELERVDFDLRDVLRETVQLFAVRAQAKQVELVLDVPAEVPGTVVGDPSRLRQVIVNLVGNALKFTDTGEVAVRVTMLDAGPHDAVLGFTVADTGPGIPREQQQRLFRAFEQLDRPRPHVEGGTGLGLVISARLVELMRGRIWVESEPGRGSRFCFTVTFGVGGRAAPCAGDPRVLEGRRVLVVDDSESNRRALDTMLRDLRLTPVLAAGGVEGLEAVERARGLGQPFDVVVLDDHMPGMSGVEFAARLRQAQPVCVRPQLLLASGGAGDASRTASNGFAGVLWKPVTHSALLDAVASALGQRARPACDHDARAATARPRRSLRVLLAEDNEVNRELEEQVLAMQGHEVVVAANGEEAVEAFRRGGIDLVLMDVNMPVMDGFAATGRIRSLEAGSGTRVPIVALTANALKGDRARCLDAGMDDYLSKPIRFEELARVVNAIADAEPPCRTVATRVQATEAIPHATGTLAAADGDPNTALAGDGAVDVRAALGFTGGAAAVLGKLVRTFRRTSPARLASIQHALARRDGEALCSAAHAFKGSAALLGGVEVTRTARELEHLGAEGRFDEAGAAFARLVREHERLDPALDDLLRLAC